MKKLTILILLFFTIVIINQAKASSYSVDEQDIDQIFEDAVETSMVLANSTESGFLPASFSPAVMGSANEKDAVVAIVLDFFLGGLGVHRFYLGTETLTGIGYILTCGGIFGIVPLIDFVVLIIDNKDTSKYIDNPKFCTCN